MYRLKILRRIVLELINFLFNFNYKKKLGNKIRVFGFPIISISKNSKINVGKNLVLISHSYFSEPGVNHPVILRTLNSSAKIVIGDNVGISGGGICAAEEVILGNNVMLGANTFITDTDFHPIDPENRRFSRENVLNRSVVIKDNVFIGMNSLILKGVTIGENSVIGAGSIVTRNIPPNSIAGGTPAKVIKSISG